LNIDPVTAGGANAPKRSTEIAGDFDTFLRLLTTQLSNQDPLSPMDSNQFTEQLVQFASVEQSVAMNERLDQILAVIDADQFRGGSHYLGKEVVADIETLQLDDTGVARFDMALADKPAQLGVRVKDEAGKTIAVLAPPPQSGAQTVVWDGRTSEGARAPAGAYTVEVEAVAADGQPVPVSTRLSGVVRAVENEDGLLFLDVDGHRVALADVTTVRQPADQDEGASS